MMTVVLVVEVGKVVVMVALVVTRMMIGLLAAVATMVVTIGVKGCYGVGGGESTVIVVVIDDDVVGVGAGLGVGVGGRDGSVG